MALTYAQIGATLDDATFQDRVVGALEAQMIIVNAEAVGTTNHAVRLQLLSRVFANPEGYAKLFAPLICSVNPLLALANVSAAADSDILTAVQAVWDGLALRGL